MQIEVRNSETKSESQIPLTLNNIGMIIKAGIRNTNPLIRANVMEGHIFSTLWKYPIAVRLNMKKTKAAAKYGKPLMAILDVLDSPPRNSPTIALGRNMKHKVTAIPQTTEDNIASLSVATTRPVAFIP